MNIVKRLFGYSDLILQSYKIRHSDDEKIKQEALQKLSKTMGKMHGLPQKIGQLISMSDSSSAEDFKALGDQSNTLSLEEFKKYLSKAWQKNCEDVLSEIDTQPHAASLGQVHKATLKDGRIVAIKLQYPGIRKSMETEIKSISWLAGLKGN
jgi:predicted unusual protein kinase regulating ubiquinone biosynthesis (AarF/ABC1/UbiB family)